MVGSGSHVDVDGLMVLALEKAGNIKVVFANDRFVQQALVFSVAPYEINSFYSVLSETDRCRVDGAFRATLTGLGSRSETVTVMPVNGDQRSFRIMSTPLPAVDTLHALVTVVDITESRRHFEQLTLLSNIVQASPTGVAIVEHALGDMSRRWSIYVNDALCGILDYEREVLLGKSIAQILVGGDLDEYSPFLQAICERRPFERDVRARIRGGQRKWVHIRTFPLDDTKWVISVDDIEERKRRDDEITVLQSAIQEASDFVLIVGDAAGLDGRISFANDAFAAFMGLNRGDLLGKTPLSLLSSDNASAVLGSLAYRATYGMPIAHEVLVSRGNGLPDAWIEVIGRPMGDERDAITWLLVGRDITARRANLQETAQFVSALDMAEDAIAIYHRGAAGFELSYVNECAALRSADVFQTLKEQLEGDVFIVKVLERLAQGASESLLIRNVDRDDEREWHTLEFRALQAPNGAVESVIARDRLVARTKRVGNDVAVSIALAKEIRRFQRVEARFDSVLQVLNNEWSLACTIAECSEIHPLTLSFKNRRGNFGFRAGFLSERPVSLEFVFEVLPPKMLTALRVFLETLAEE